MKKSILLLITLLLSISVCAQTEEEISEWADKGIAALEKEDFQEASLYFEKIKEVYGEYSQNDEFYGKNLFLLADCYFNIGDYSKAVEYGTKVIEIFKATLGENHPYYTRALNELAKYYYNLSDYPKAEEYGTKEMEITKATLGENHPDYATLLNDLALYYSNLGDYSKAVEYGTKEMEITKATLGEDHPDYALSLNNLANYYSDLGDYNKAIEYGSKAIDILKATLGENHPDYASALSNLANNYSFIGKFSKAIVYGKKAMEIRKATLGENHPDYALSLGCMSNYYSLLGEYSIAVKYGTKALEIFKITIGEFHPQYATALNNLAYYYFQLHDKTKAVEYGTKAKETLKGILGENHPDYAYCLSNLTLYYYTLGDNTRALENLKKYISIIHSNTIQQFSSLTTSLRTSHWFTRSVGFTDYYPFFASVSNFSSDQETIADLYDKSALFSKGLLLTTEREMNKLILESGDEEALKMFEELQTQRQQLQELYETPIAERNANTDSLAQAAERLESKLMKRSKAYGDFTRKLRTTWKDVQAALGNDEIAVEFLSFYVIDSDNTMVAALTLRKDDKAPKFIPLFEQSQIEALDDSPALKNSPWTQEKIKSLRYFIRPEVTDLVWKPLQEELNGIHRIYFSPSGILHNIGIEYLPGMENYDIRRLSTTREIIDMKERTGKKKSANMTATLYGGIDYEAADNIAKAKNENEKDVASRGISASLHHAFIDSLGLRGDSLNGLPGTLTEVENIKASFKEKRQQVDMLTGAEATETSLKALSAHSPGILHIATHGKFYREKKKMDARRMLLQNDDRLRIAELEDKALTRSVLFFAGANHALRDEDIPMDADDGILTALEISKLDLRNLDLVVLSACQTGLGDIAHGEGVFGLQRGFKKAGAGTIVMSLWNISDNATQMMMTQFYKNLCNGMDKHEALQMAQKHLREYKDENGENIYNYPLYWAAFIILD